MALTLTRLTLIADLSDLTLRPTNETAGSLHFQARGKYIIDLNQRFEYLVFFPTFPTREICVLGIDHVQ